METTREDRSDEAPSGVDRSLVAWMLGLTPRERLRWLEERAREIERLRNLRRGG